MGVKYTQTHKSDPANLTIVLSRDVQILLSGFVKQANLTYIGINNSTKGNIVDGIYVIN